MFNVPKKSIFVKGLFSKSQPKDFWDLFFVTSIWRKKSIYEKPELFCGDCTFNINSLGQTDLFSIFR
jgi:hypothetical protein